MSDVIEAMARDYCLWLGEDPDGLSEIKDGARRWYDYAGIAKRGLRTAEKAGWRLVPDSAAGQSIQAGSEEFGRWCDADDARLGYSSDAAVSIYSDMIEAAPRPWEDDHG